MQKVPSLLCSDKKGNLLRTGNSLDNANSYCWLVIHWQFLDYNRLDTERCCEVVANLATLTNDASWLRMVDCSTEVLHWSMVLWVLLSLVHDLLMEWVSHLMNYLSIGDAREKHTMRHY